MLIWIIFYFKMHVNVVPQNVPAEEQISRFWGVFKQVNLWKKQLFANKGVTKRN